MQVCLGIQLLWVSLVREGGGIEVRKGTAQKDKEDSAQSGQHCQLPGENPEERAFVGQGLAENVLELLGLILHVFMKAELCLISY